MKRGVVIVAVLAALAAIAITVATSPGVRPAPAESLPTSRHSVERIHNANPFERGQPGEQGDSGAPPAEEPTHALAGRPGEVGETDEWRVRGRVEFAKDLIVDPLALKSWDRPGVEIGFARAIESDYEIAEEWQELGEDFSFDSTVSDAGLLEMIEAGGTTGLWQVTLDFGDPIDLFDFANDRAELKELHGIVTPQVVGRVIDFGTVTLGNAAIFGRQHVAVGQLVHSSGQPLTHARGIRLVVDGEHAREDAVLHTDAQGRFAVALDALLKEPADKYTHCFYAHDDIWERIGDGYTMPGEDVLAVSVEPPAVRGRTLDYGKVVVGGALLRITADIPGASTLTRPSGELDVDFDGDYDGQRLELWVQRVHAAFYSIVYPKPHVSTIWLNEGRYFYDAAMQQTQRYFPDISGVVDCRDGVVTDLHLVCAAVGSIPLEIHTDTGEAQDATIRWDCVRDGEVVASGRVEAVAPFQAPVVAGTVTDIRAIVSGYAEGTGTANPNDERMVIKLQREGANAAALLRVHVKGIPPVDHPSDLTVDVQVSRPDSGLEPLKRLNDGEMFIFFLPEAGLWRITVLGNARYKDWRTVASGVDVVLIEGEEHDAFVEVGPAQLPAELVNQITCGGSNCKASLALTAGGVPWSLEANTGEEVYLPSTPVAIVDGDVSIPLERTESTGPYQPAQVSVDLEVRATLRVTRRGRAVTNYRLDIHGSYASVWRTEGLQQLWFPEGKSTFTVSVDGCSVTRTVSVLAGQVQEVEVELEAVLLNLSMPENESYDAANRVTDVPPMWFLQAQDGTCVDEVCGSGTHWLQPGKYRLVSGYGKDMRSIDADLTSGEDLELELPALPELRLAEVKLLCDTTVFGIASTDVEAGVYFVEGFRKPGNVSERINYDAECMPDGLLVARLPADTPLVLYCRVWASTAWITRPLALRLSPGMQSITVELTRPGELSRAWPREVDAYTASLVPGVLLPLEHVAVPGAHEVAVFADGTEVARQWIDVADGSVEFPAALEEALRAKGVIDDD